MPLYLKKNDSPNIKASNAHKKNKIAITRARGTDFFFAKSSLLLFLIIFLLSTALIGSLGPLLHGQ